MDSAERMDVIVARLRAEGEVSVAALAELTGHSEMTIRRDLDHLSDKGVLRRVHGGAVSLLPRGQEPPYAIRERMAVDAKKRIGRAVGELVDDGQAVLLDRGTTVVEAARALAERHVTVMPLSLQAAAVLSESNTVRLLMPGGEVRPGELAMTGPLTEASLAAVRFDTAVLSCCGLSLTDGVTAYDLADVAIKRAAMRSARQVVLVADSTKIGQVTMGHVGPVSDVDVLVTDTGASDDSIAEIRAAGVAVHRV